MLVILKEGKSSSKFYSRMCQQLAVLDSEKVTACSQKPELYHRMLTKDFHYLLFKDQVIVFIYIFNSNYLINAAKCTTHALNKWIVPHFHCKF